ncbi:uncharacterized protein LOC121755403 isoform X2 [Salvia splendens]|nr:uncharacterized protein LOC121755403 isoform X2 [Salvia splendens]
MELVVKEVDSGFGRNGSDTKWKYADNTDEHRAVGINICSTTLDTDARLIPPRIDTTCLGIPGCVDWLHFWMPDNHKAEQCLWNKTACKDHEPNLVERLDGSVEVSGVTDVKVSESKDGGQDFFGYTEDVVTEGAADDTFIKMSSEKDNNEFIEKGIDSPHNDILMETKRFLLVKLHLVMLILESLMKGLVVMVGLLGFSEVVSATEMEKVIALIGI